jgi:hypothetical protein
MCICLFPELALYKVNTVKWLKPKKLKVKFIQSRLKLDENRGLLTLVDISLVDINGRHCRACGSHGNKIFLWPKFANLTVVKLKGWAEVGRSAGQCTFVQASGIEMTYSKPEIVICFLTVLFCNYTYFLIQIKLKQ